MILLAGFSSSLDESVHFFCQSQKKEKKKRKRRFDTSWNQFHVTLTEFRDFIPVFALKCKLMASFEIMHQVSTNVGRYCNWKPEPLPADAGQSVHFPIHGVPVSYKSHMLSPGVDLHSVSATTRCENLQIVSIGWTQARSDLSYFFAVLIWMRTQHAIPSSPFIHDNMKFNDDWMPSTGAQSSATKMSYVDLDFG